LFTVEFLNYDKMGLFELCPSQQDAATAPGNPMGDGACDVVRERRTRPPCGRRTLPEQRRRCKAQRRSGSTSPPQPPPRKLSQHLPTATRAEDRSRLCPENLRTRQRKSTHTDVDFTRCARWRIPAIRPQLGRRPQKAPADPADGLSISATAPARRGRRASGRPDANPRGPHPADPVSGPGRASGARSGPAERRSLRDHPGRGRRAPA